MDSRSDEYLLGYFRGTLLRRGRRSRYTSVSVTFAAVASLLMDLAGLIEGGLDGIMGEKASQACNCIMRHSHSYVLEVHVC